ncbi:DUF4302 domain-containing protein [Tenacibaculum soleae]|uniref:DUF4302 domain-containing protein n=1 Tax=Tenacibaculum soleae TaxID=447689 RepID=UPI00230064FB|nr:DUF4302 domain-containing protein [Tenacibaculum soleae]
MKKNIIKNLLFIAIAIITTACNNDNFESTFNETPSARVEKVMNEYSDLLSSSENGWIIEYYPERNQVYGGFNYAVKFDAAKAAIVSYEGADDITKTESSTYDIIASGGPVLTFNTYNKYMHEFANPSFTEYQAKQGDYEFYLTSKDDNTITIQGIKSGNTMRMIKLDETPEAYLTKVADISYNISLSSGIAINGEDNDVNLGNRHIAFSITDEDPINMAYNYTPTGIKLYESITISGNEVTEFTLDKAQNQLISLDGSVIIDLIVAPFNVNQDWTIDTTDFSTISADFFGKYVDIYNANGARYGEYLQRAISFGNNGETGGISFLSLAPPTQLWTSRYNLNFSPVLGESDQLAITKNGEGLNWSFYTHLNPLLDYIVDNAPYIAEPNTPTNPTEVKLTSTVDANAWFIIKL